MHHYENERQFKIAETVTTVKMISMIFFLIAIYIELPQHTLTKEIFAAFGFETPMGSIMVLTLFLLLILLISYYKKMIILNKSGKKQLIYDVVEIIVFVLLITFLIIVSGMQNSPYKILIFFIMISVTIQHGTKYGIIVSSVCSAILIAIDIIVVPTKPNPSLQIDLILSGVLLMITWLVGYYRSVEAQYSLKMFNLANKDDLTGLYSHGYFQNALTEQFRKAKENNKHLSLMFIDIDYFKCFNDLYGHQAGDEVLKETGAIVESHMKPPYLAARYGGEEFTVIMYGAAKPEAVELAESIRKDIESTFVDKFAEINKITVSIGISNYPSNAENKDELIKYADDALYRAKSFHKNRVETYQSVLEELEKDIEGDDVKTLSSIKTLISIINIKDKYTYRHVERVVIYCGLIANALHLSEHDKKILKYGAYLHDIGKINTPEEVLNKKMPLTAEEWFVMKRHPEEGVRIVSPVKSLADSIPIILYHHERYDGEGYPEKLSGEEIPYLARILTIADSFDAMTSNRPYRAAKSFKEGIQELEAYSSTQYDPELVEVFIKILKSKKDIFK